MNNLIFQNEKEIEEKINNFNKMKKEYEDINKILKNKELNLKEETTTLNNKLDKLINENE